MLRSSFEGDTLLRGVLWSVEAGGASELTTAASSESLRDIPREAIVSLNGSAPLWAFKIDVTRLVTISLHAAFDAMCLHPSRVSSIAPTIDFIWAPE
mmetsp:Transcript_9585/g.20588  ORF Transcript_9585/g.20588 Transcript_9585/m.20588 type:complete len:97 (+) Transcript_9585:145-435(+)